MSNEPSKFESPTDSTAADAATDDVSQSESAETEATSGQPPLTSPPDTTDDSAATSAPTPAAEAAAAETAAAETAAAETAAAETPAAETPAAETPAAETPAAETAAAGGGIGRIQIGRRSGATPPQRASKPLSEELAAAANVTEMPVSSAPTIPNAPVPTPSRRDKLSADLEKEIQDALGGASIDDLMTADAPQVSELEGGELEVDSRRRGTVVKLHGDNVFFTLGGPHEGVVSVRQFKEKPKPGDSLDVIVSGFNAEDGLYELRVPGAAMDVSDWEDVQEGSVVAARVTGANTGGLECMVNTIRGFIPASQIALFRVENFADYIDKRLPCVVTEANKSRKNLVLSHRAVLEREREVEREAQLATLEVGAVCEGIVRSIREFGAFVDLGGVDGLIHISQLSWDRVEHPSEVVSEGEKVRVRIEKVNPETGKISLSLRSMQEHPWANVEEQFAVNAVVKGTVSRTAKFGAFVKLAPGIEGLIHVSELAHHRVSRVDTVVSEGQEVEVKIVSVDPKEQRIGLSLKALLGEPEKGTKKPSEEDALDEPREMAVPQRDGPLKGGTDRPSGGEEFGLKW